jgi:hypothetical protein
MIESFLLSMPTGRARSTFAVNCYETRWLGGHDALVTGAEDVSPITTAKRNAPGSLEGALT